MSKPSPEAVRRTVSRMIADLGPVEYLGDPRTSPRRKKIARDLLLSEDERRAEDAAEEADLRSVAEDGRAEVSIKGS